MIGTRPPKESLELLLPGLLALLAVIVGVSMAVVLSAQARFVGNEGMLGTGLGSMSVGFGLVCCSKKAQATPPKPLALTLGVC
jgi:hypothetical protein